MFFCHEFNWNLRPSFSCVLMYSDACERFCVPKSASAKNEQNVEKKEDEKEGDNDDEK